MTEPKKIGQTLSNILSALFKICGILFLLYLLCSVVWRIGNLVSSSSKQRADTKVVTSTATFHIGNYEHIPGTDVWRAPVIFDNNSPAILVSMQTSEIRNYAFFNVATKHAYWLKSKSEDRITQLRSYPDDTYRLDKIATRFFIALLEGKKAENSGPSLSVAIADPIGEHFTTILVGIDAVQAIMDNGEKEAIILYEKNGKLRYCSFDLKQWRVLNDLESNEVVIEEKH